jgi:hypothetical protein
MTQETRSPSQAAPDPTRWSPLGDDPLEQLEVDEDSEEEILWGRNPSQPG